MAFPDETGRCKPKLGAGHGIWAAEPGFASWHGALLSPAVNSLILLEFSPHGLRQFVTVRPAAAVPNLGREPRQPRLAHMRKEPWDF